MTRLSQHNRREETGTLFPMQGQIRIVEIGEPEVSGWDDHVKVLRALINANQNMYPDIDRWFSTKVLPGLKSSERIAYVAYEGENPIASAVLKLGQRAKFCHLRIREDFQDQDLGQMFFTLMTLEIRHHAEEVHFTLPESLWTNKSRFFKSFGFSTAKKASRQYRQGDAELVCSAPLQTVLSAVLTKMPDLITKFSVGGHFLGSDLLMSVKPEYAERLLSGTKLVEIRKRFSKKWLGRRAVLYASKPQGALVGEATIHSITHGRPDDIWARFENNIGASLDEFKGYTASDGEVCAIQLSDIHPYRAPVPLDQIEYILQQDLRPPQSYCELNMQKNAPWAKAVSIATLLHSRCRVINRSSVAAP
ncbi:MAG: ASCH domain-containing protein [Terriglobia bacterium]